MSVVAEYLMLYYDHVLADSRIPGMMQAIADFMISQCRLLKSGEAGFGMGSEYGHPYLPVAPAGLDDVECFPATMPMFAAMFAWVYRNTNNSTYLTWADRCMEPDNIAPSHLDMQVKLWGEFFGGNRLSALYYRDGGAIRGTSGVHPSSITQPTIHAGI